ncbi:DsbA family oxidoreductase [Gleimia hominis]|uniref:DsbA family oxidoreductase n=1 Tax=Gleimia hominis TaxID=595468 RepID=UPI001E418F45|nr:DsbA family oxidoreductase [Gleimia hominis]WIK64989.1 DsbA family oxidoreductase [Gleimia hominis]
MMHIDIWSDIACPWSYLGVRHMRQALRDFEHRDNVRLTLHAYLLRPELEKTTDKTALEYLAENKDMTREEVQEALESVTKLGSEEGLHFDWDRVRIAPTTSAHRLVFLARELDLENDTTIGPDTMELKVNEALQRAYFEMGADISHPETLISIVQDFNIDGKRVLEALESPDTGTQVFSDFQVGVQIGVNSVPTFVFNSQFVVAQSLPAKAYANALETAWESAAQKQDR